MKITLPALTKDQQEYLERLEAERWDPLKLCTACGVPMVDHTFGGPGPSCPPGGRHA